MKKRREQAAKKKPLPIQRGKKKLAKKRIPLEEIERQEREAKSEAEKTVFARHAMKTTYRVNIKGVGTCEVTDSVGSYGWEPEVERYYRQLLYDVTGETAPKEALSVLVKERAAQEIKLLEYMERGIDHLLPAGFEENLRYLRRFQVPPRDPIIRVLAASEMSRRHPIMATKTTDKKSAKKAVKGKARGRGRGPGAATYCFELIAANNEKKLTDAQIVAAINKKFPDNGTFKYGPGRITYFRNQYNMGKSPLPKPSSPSKPFGKDGKAAEKAKKGRKPAEKAPAKKVAKKAVKKAVKKAAPADAPVSGE